MSTKCLRTLCRLRKNGHFRLFAVLTASENARNGLLRKPPRTRGKAARYDFTQRAAPSETPL